jgi:hypothetical protein
MSPFTRDDLLILESVLCDEDFSICQEVFKNDTLLEFLEADDLDLAYGRTQSRLKHLITVVNPWSCVDEKVASFTETTGICLSDPSPCTLIWNGFCTIGCPLCNALKNYALRNDLYLGRRWRYRSTYRRLHGKLLAIITHFLEDNIVQMVNKHNQNMPPASELTSCVHPEPIVEEELDAVTETPVSRDRISPLSEAEPFKSMFMFYLNSDRPPTEDEVSRFLGLDDCESLLQDHVENDETRPSLLT